MSKLKLNLDGIKVDSYQINNEIMYKKGTVIGNMELPKTTQTNNDDSCLCTMPTGCSITCNLECITRDC